MEISKRLFWLRRILLIKLLLVFLAWAPALILPLALVRLLGLPVPENPVYLRLFGALQTSLGVAYYYAFRDPSKNIAIVKVGIFENGLVALTIITLGLTYGIPSVFIWISCVLAALFCIAFAILLPK